MSDIRKYIRIVENAEKQPSTFTREMKEDIRLRNLHHKLLHMVTEFDGKFLTPFSKEYIERHIKDGKIVFSNDPIVKWAFYFDETGITKVLCKVDGVTSKFWVKGEPHPSKKSAELSKNLKSYFDDDLHLSN